jgi:primosomal protein N'
MDGDLMRIAYAAGGMQQAQTLNAIQVQLLQNAMDTQSQNAQALLQGMTGSTVTASHPYLGKQVDVYV